MDMVGFVNNLLNVEQYSNPCELKGLEICLECEEDCKEEEGENET